MGFRRSTISINMPIKNDRGRDISPTFSIVLLNMRTQVCGVDMKPCLSLAGMHIHNSFDRAVVNKIQIESRKTKITCSDRMCAAVNLLMVKLSLSDVHTGLVDDWPKVNTPTLLVRQVLPPSVNI